MRVDLAYADLVAGRAGAPAGSARGTPQRPFRRTGHWAARSWWRASTRRALGRSHSPYVSGVRASSGRSRVGPAVPPLCFGVAALGGLAVATAPTPLRSALPADAKRSPTSRRPRARGRRHLSRKGDPLALQRLTNGVVGVKPRDERTLGGIRARNGTARSDRANETPLLIAVRAAECCTCPPTGLGRAVDRALGRRVRHRPASHQLTPTFAEPGPTRNPQQWMKGLALAG